MARTTRFTISCPAAVKINKMIFRRSVIAGLALVAISLGSLAGAQDTAPLPVFKGSWAGPPPVSAQPAGPVPARPFRGQAGARSPSRKHVLVLGGARGWHHDSIPAGMAAVYGWGRTSGLWDAEMRSEFSLVNGSGGAAMTAGFRPSGLKDFDAIVVVSATGDWGLDASQKAALLDFVRGGGGLVVMHGGIDANHGWRDYIDMVGGEFVSHPFNTGRQPLFPFPLLNENPATSMTAFLPRQFVKQDELYVIRNFARDDIEVLVSVDKSALDMSAEAWQLPPDRDIPVAWIKGYGNGRVFASTIGHASESFDDPEVARMYAEAIKWVLSLTGPDPRRRQP
jgi:type 1 glutamine amidotransferase